MRIFWNEWNGYVYFEYPWRGAVYEAIIDDRQKDGFFVRIPLDEEVIVQLDNNEEHSIHPISSELRDSLSENYIFTAQKVFDPFNDEDPVYNDNWLELLWKLNAAAATNNLFHILLTGEEYLRLMISGWETLLHLMSPRARSLAVLHEEFYMDEQDRPAIELLRTGCCP